MFTNKKILFLYFFILLKTKVGTPNLVRLAPSYGVTYNSLINKNKKHEMVLISTTMGQSYTMVN
jgi:hypothetical protein